jgi:hypothetical protein
MKYLMLGVRGVAQGISAKLREAGNEVFCVSNGVDVYSGIKDYWVKCDLTEPAAPITIIQQLLEERPFDGIIFGEYVRINEDEAGVTELFQIRKQLEANIVQTYILYKYAIRYQFVTEDCHILFLLDGTRNSLDQNFLMYRLSQDSLILLMGLLNANRVKNHCINCVEVGVRPDEESVDIALKVLHSEQDISGRVVPEGEL